VRDVEYQGSSVVVSLAAENGSELTAVVPERSFYERPFTVGDRAAVHWDPADMRDLQ
jgi:putative spermidine/putrescine transport system ATP-binding protein